MTAHSNEQLIPAMPTANGSFSEQRYRVLADSMPQMVWATDANGAHIYFNQRWYEYTGLSEQQSLGFGFANALHPDDVARTLARWERAWSAGESYEIEYRFRRYDGSYHWFIGRAQPVSDDAGQIVEWVGTCTDIDEQKRSRESLRFLAESSSLLATSLDYEATLAQVAQLAVPMIADWCAVDMLDGPQRVQRLAVAHIDPAKIALAKQLEQRTPYDPQAPIGLPAVLRNGRSELFETISEELIITHVADLELRQILLKLGLRSSMIVPLIARGHTLGAITFVAAESGRHFGEADLALAEDLARRAAIAIDNVLLFQELSQFKTTLDQTLDSVFMFEPESLRFFYVNQGAVDQVGYTREELLELTPLALITDLDEAQLRALIAPLIAGEQSRATFQTTHRHKQGQRVPVEVALQYVAVDATEGRCVAVVRDISERQRYVAEIAQQARLIDMAREAIIMRDEEGRIRYWNRGAEELYGWTRAEAEGQITHILLQTRFLDDSLTEQRDLLSGGGAWEGELVHTRRDGSRIVVESRQLGVVDAFGVRTEILEINRDTTARKQTEAELRASEQRYRALADAMPLMVWITGPDGSGIYYSQRWLDYTGLSSEAANDAAWLDQLHPDDRERYMQRWQQCLATGDPFEIEYRFRRHDGVYRWQLVRAVAISANGSRIAYWVGTNTDIDEQKRNEVTLRERSKQLTRATRQLEERNRELDQFAYITSHDLKAPLRGIANLSQWIEEDLGEHVTDEARQHLELLRGRVMRMEALIDGILQYSRVGRVGMAPRAVDIAALLDEIIDLLAPPPGVRIEVAPGMPTLMAERLLLQQVFANLIGNAIKHHPGPTAHIRVSANEQAGQVEFAVADDGPGIAPQYHERIFGIFQTLASRDRVEGSGLGLALVKKIVEHQGGRIWIESSEGAGATFRFTWPTQASAEE